MKVAKFGGTSMADADSIKLVAEILTQDDSRRVAVVSAPGCSLAHKEKVTDMLYANRLSQVKKRFVTIMNGLELDPEPLHGMFRWIARASVQSRVAFGEYLSAYILARYLGWKFVDARRVFVIDEHGLCRYDDEQWQRLLQSPKSRLVVPGFYGASPHGGVALFPRGGSDMSGAYAAAAARATVYENWTDVSGFYTEDPHVFPAARHLPMLTYEAAQNLARAGARVLHPSAILPMANRGIPIHVRNTFRPDLPGTMIVPDIGNYNDPS